MPIFSVVILTAIPTGLGADGAGAFVKVDGRESLLRSADVFFNRDGIKQIQLVVADDKFEEAKRKFGDHLSFSGAKLIAGPSQWMDQLETAAQKIPAEVTHVIVHDAARPAVAFTDLDVLLAEAEKHPVAVMTTPLRGGIIETEDSGKPIALRSGQRFQNVVTPWALRKDKFLEMVKNQARTRRHGNVARPFLRAEHSRRQRRRRDFGQVHAGHVAQAQSPGRGQSV